MAVLVGCWRRCPSGDGGLLAVWVGCWRRCPGGVGDSGGGGLMAVIVAVGCWQRWWLPGGETCWRWLVPSDG